MKKANKDLLTINKKHKQKMFCQFVEKVICKYYNLKTISLHEKNRKRDICKTRQICIYFCKMLNDMSMTYVGSYYDITHATVIHAIKTTKNQMAWDKDLRSEINEIHNIIDFEFKVKNKALSLSGDFYYMDLDNFNSIKTNDKTIILVGFNDYEINEFLIKNNIKEQPRKHFNTELYVLEDKQAKISIYA